MTPRLPLLVIGALIGLDRFHGAIPGVRLPVMLLYWTGQLGIALATLWRCPPAESAVS